MFLCTTLTGPRATTVCSCSFRSSVVDHGQVLLVDVADALKQVVANAGGAVEHRLDPCPARLMENRFSEHLHILAYMAVFSSSSTLAPPKPPSASSEPSSSVGCKWCSANGGIREVS